MGRDGRDDVLAEDGVLDSAVSGEPRRSEEGLSHDLDHDLDHASGAVAADAQQGAQQGAQQDAADNTVTDKADKADEWPDGFENNFSDISEKRFDRNVPEQNDIEFDAEKKGPGGRNIAAVEFQGAKQDVKDADVKDADDEPLSIDEIGKNQQPEPEVVVAATPRWWQQFRVRYFFLVFLAVVVVAPLVVTGSISVMKSTDTAVSEVRLGSQRVAKAVAGEIQEYIEGERKLIQAIGQASLQMRDPAGRQIAIDSFLATQTHIARAAVFDLQGDLVAGNSGLRDGLEDALVGKSTILPIHQEEDGLSIGQVVIWAEPVRIAGNRQGAIVAEVELVGLWRPIDTLRIGKTGFVALVSTDGLLLAHGKSVERGRVYGLGYVDDGLIEAAANDGQFTRVIKGRKERLLVASAPVPLIDGVILVEQARAEALSSVTAMRHSFYWFYALATVLVVVLGLVFSRQVVDPLEQLGRHVEILGRGELDKIVDVSAATRLTEPRELAGSVNKMAADLDALQKAQVNRERMNTFARVAAGLAHDLRHPIEALRMVWIPYQKEPSQENLELLAVVTEIELPKLKQFAEELEGLAKTGSLSLALCERNALTLVETAVAQIQAVPAWGGVIVFSSKGEKSLAIRVDPPVMIRAVYNLMRNAAEACLARKNGGKVTVEVCAVDDPTGPMVGLHVRDNGCGIEPERIGSLLTTDFKSTKRSTGVGLGLGVVRQVVESHGGRIGITSQLGAGSVFTIYLPTAARSCELKVGEAGGENNTVAVTGGDA